MGKITSMTLKFGPPPKRRPKIGDKKVRKDGVVLVRRQIYVNHFGIWGGLANRHGPVCEWVPEGTPEPWERDK